MINKLSNKDQQWKEMSDRNSILKYEKKNTCMGLHKKLHRGGNKSL